MRLPESPEAEIAVLGSVFFEPSVIVEVSSIVVPADFHMPSNRAMYVETRINCMGSCFIRLIEQHEI